jgi:hypothetical protein
MVIGGIICPEDQRKHIYKDIKGMKIKHNIKPYTEIKWTKVSKSKQDFYYDLINYFFDNANLGFRAIFLDKTKLDHEKFNQTPDEFYYKMYYLMVKGVFEANTQYNIYLDIKDTLGYKKVQQLKEICNKLRHRKGYSNELVKKIQEVRSHEVELIQLSDLLIGAVGYVNRGIVTNDTKLKIIEQIKSRSGYNLKVSTFLKENKFNLFNWNPQEEVMRWD